jgi:hypothetical protein
MVRLSDNDEKLIDTLIAKLEDQRLFITQRNQVIKVL